MTLATSWDVDLVRDVGLAPGIEARAQGIDMLLGPGINIKRSPLCGRNFEYYSEDRLLSGRLAAAMISGIQSVGVAATVKHFAVNNQETERLRISADVDPRALHEIYLRTFEIAIREGKPWALMTSYNRINGVPASEDHWLLTKVLRDDWGFDGVVMSDWGGVRDPVAAVHAGLDVRMPGPHRGKLVSDTIGDGAIGSERIEASVRRLWSLGERTATNAAPPIVDDAAHHEVARRAAVESAVLLHNDAGLLPLDPSAGERIALIGALAANPRYQGAGSSVVNPTRLRSAHDVMQERFGGRLSCVAGYHPDGSTDDRLTRDAVALAAKVDVVVLFLGLPPSHEAEGIDRTSLDLPDGHLALLKAVTAANARVVVVLSNGAPVATHAWRGDVGAILELWLTGEAHGEAVADLLTGVADPGGRLAETIPIRLEDTPWFLNFPGEVDHVRYGERIVVGYRWYDARRMEIDYPFGHGLSYARFDHTDLSIDVRSADDPVAFTATVRVTTIGDRDDTEVVQLYVSEPYGLLAMPERQLRAFAKVRLRAGETGTLTLSVTRASLRHFHKDTGWIDPTGPMRVALGDSSRDLRLVGEIVLPGAPVREPLGLDSSLRDWLSHPVAGPDLRSMIDAGGGFTGRIADLMSDPVGSETVLSIPIASFLLFGGAPIDERQVDGLLRELSAELAGRRISTAPTSPELSRCGLTANRSGSDHRRTTAQLLFFATTFAVQALELLEHGSEAVVNRGRSF